MEHTVNVLLTLLLMSDLMLVTSSRIFNCIKLAAAQGLILGVLPLLALKTEPHPFELICLALINIAVKGVLLPYLLGRSVKKVGVKREIEPYVGYSASAVILTVGVLISFIIAGKIDIPAGGTI
jgi:hydrogenase-4 component E